MRVIFEGNYCSNPRPLSVAPLCLFPSFSLSLSLILSIYLSLIFSFLLLCCLLIYFFALLCFQIIPPTLFFFLTMEIFTFAGSLKKSSISIQTLSSYLCLFFITCLSLISFLPCSFLTVSSSLLLNLSLFPFILYSFALSRSPSRLAHPSSSSRSLCWQFIPPPASLGSPDIKCAPGSVLPVRWLRRHRRVTRLSRGDKRPPLMNMERSEPHTPPSTV